MKKLLIESKGIKKDKYYIPSFELRSGEIIVISLYNGVHYYNMKMELVEIFNEKIKNENVNIFEPLTFVNYFKEPHFRRIFYPITVGEYLKKNANLESDFAKKIYESNGISKSTKWNTITWYQRKLLSLYSTFSKSTNIVFDLDGIGPDNAKKIYQIVKEEVKKGGSAILIDWTDDIKEDCSRFIKVEWF